MAISWRNEPILDSVQLPGSNTKYWVADKEAREKLETVIGATRFMGVTTTELTDGATTNPITINSESYTAGIGDIVIYKENRGTDLDPVWVPLEFIQDGNAWQFLGDQSFDNLGDLAYKDSASVSYTPEGSVNLTPATMDVVTSVIHSFGINVNFSSESVAGYSDVCLGLEVCLSSNSISYFGSDQALNYVNLASKNSKGASYTSIVTDVNYVSYSAIGEFTSGTLPTISNTSTITATMGTGSSSTTLIFSLSDIGFDPGTQPVVSYCDVYGPSRDGISRVTYASVSFFTLEPNTTDIVCDASGYTTSLYYSVSLTGDIETTTGSALSGITATFAGSASTITVS